MCGVIRARNREHTGGCLGERAGSRRFADRLRLGVRRRRQPRPDGSARGDAHSKRRRNQVRNLEVQSGGRPSDPKADQHAIFWFDTTGDGRAEYAVEFFASPFDPATGQDAHNWQVDLVSAAGSTDSCQADNFSQKISQQALGGGLGVARNTEYVDVSWPLSKLGNPKIITWGGAGYNYGSSQLGLDYMPGTVDPLRGNPTTEDKELCGKAASGHPHGTGHWLDLFFGYTFDVAQGGPTATPQSEVPAVHSATTAVTTKLATGAAVSAPQTVQVAVPGPGALNTSASLVTYLGNALSSVKPIFVIDSSSGKTLITDSGSSFISDNGAALLPAGNKIISWDGGSIVPKGAKIIADNGGGLAGKSGGKFFSDNGSGLAYASRTVGNSGGTFAYGMRRPAFRFKGKPLRGHTVSLTAGAATATAAGKVTLKLRPAAKTRTIINGLRRSERKIRSHPKVLMMVQTTFKPKIGRSVTVLRLYGLKP